MLLLSEADADSFPTLVLGADSSFGIPYHRHDWPGSDYIVPGVGSMVGTPLCNGKEAAKYSGEELRALVPASVYRNTRVDEAAGEQNMELREGDGRYKPHKTRSRSYNNEFNSQNLSKWHRYPSWTSYPGSHYRVLELIPLPKDCTKNGASRIREHRWVIA